MCILNTTHGEYYNLHLMHYYHWQIFSLFSLSLELVSYLRKAWFLIALLCFNDGIQVMILLNDSALFHKHIYVLAPPPHNSLSI